MTDRYNLGNIRTLLIEGFSENELRSFCFDHPNFRDVHNQLSENTGQSQIVYQLVEHADRKELFTPLLSWAEKQAPARYKRHQPYYATPSIAIPTNNHSRHITETALTPPLPSFDANLTKKLMGSGGAIKIQDPFYIERQADIYLAHQFSKESGDTTTIRAPRQTGKTSLLIRGIHQLRQQKRKVLFLDLQGFIDEQLTSFDIFLQSIGEVICDELNLDDEILEIAWQRRRSPQRKFERFMEKHILPNFSSLLLAIDEADSLLRTNFYQDFFRMLRTWHNRRAFEDIWQNLSVALVISTEPYLLIKNLDESPFNVGLEINLTDFDISQLIEINRRHGSPLSKDELNDLNNLLEGHPYLTRRALYAIVVQQISWAKIKQIAPTYNGPFGSHLRYQHRILQNQPQLQQALKQIIDTHHCFDETSLARLLQAGLVKGIGKIYQCRCNLYSLYFQDKLS